MFKSRKTKQIVRYRKRIVPRTITVRPELKRLVFPIASINMASIGTAWRETDLCGSLQTGATFNTRTGSKISVHSVRWRGVMAGGAVGAGGIDDYYNSMRLVIFTHKSPKTGAAITPLTTAGVNGSQSFTRDYIPGLDRVLHDKFHGLTNPPYGANLCAPGTFSFDIYHLFPGRGLEVQFSNTGVETDQTGIYVAAISDSAAIPHCGQVIGNAEITWYDL